MELQKLELRLNEMPFVNSFLSHTERHFQAVRILTT